MFGHGNDENILKNIGSSFKGDEKRFPVLKRYNLDMLIR
jgi:hypothetical protein